MPFWIAPEKSDAQAIDIFSDSAASRSGNYMFKVNYRNARTSCEICSKLTIKTPERRFHTLF